MNIKGFGSVTPNDLKAQQSTNKAEKASTGSPESLRRGGDPSASGATVQLSSQAKDLKQIEKSLSGLSDVDQSRVNDLKKRIDSGEYQVNSRNVAEKLLGFEGDL